MIIRTYHCDVCGDNFEVTCESNDPDPPCPYCDKVLEWVPGMFAIGTHKGKAVDITQKILEQDFGLTNFKDNTREGDINAIMPVETTAERDALTRTQVEYAVQKGLEDFSKPVNHPGVDAAIKGFWSGGGAAGVPQHVAQAFVDNAKVGRMRDGNEYVDPVGFAQHAAKRAMPSNFKKIG